jgi:hypothetical protein
MVTSSQISQIADGDLTNARTEEPADDEKPKPHLRIGSSEMK